MQSIEGTEKIQELLREIVKNFMAQKPQTKHVDYEITQGKHKSLQTEETDGILRNVSIIKLGKLQLAVGNQTGDILILKKPIFISKKGILRKLTKFLKKIQPDVLAKSKKIEKDSYSDTSFFSGSATQTRSSITFTIHRRKIRKSIAGSNIDAREEHIDEFKTL